MSYTYLEACNDVISELNEVLLTDSSFPNAVNVQRTVKEMVNRAYMDINNPTFQWPWLATSESLNNFYGNAYIETVAGQRWYLIKEGSTDFNTDYGHVNWDQFSLTTEGVAGEVDPYITRKLAYISATEWRDFYQRSEDMNKLKAASYDAPKRIIRNPDNRHFGVSPLPDKVYRIYFYAWDRPVKLTNYDSLVNIPDQYYQVLLSRVRYYAWQRKENAQQASIALEEYETGLRGMRQQEIERSPERITDDRLRFV